MEEWKKAYIAGYFDGDGTVNGFIMKSGSHKGEIRTAISIDSINPDPIYKIYEWINFLGHTGYKPYKINNKRTNRRDLYRIRLNTQKDIVAFLELILPYLIIKRKQAELMIEYCKSRLSKDNILVDYYKNDRLYRIPQKPSYTEEEKNLIYQIGELNY